MIDSRTLKFLVIPLVMLAGPPAFAADEEKKDSEMELGISSYRNHAYYEALGHLGAALPTDFSNANLHYHMANCMVHVRQKEGAIREYRIAYALEPYGKVGNYSKQCLKLFGIDATGAMPLPEAPAKIEKDAKNASSNAKDEKSSKDGKNSKDGRAQKDGYDSKKDPLASVAKFVSEEEKTKQNLLDLMEQKERPGSAKLQKIGTNIFVRNYKDPNKTQQASTDSKQPPGKKM